MISLHQTLFSMVKNESIPLKIRNKTRVSTFITIIQHSSGVLASAIREEKKRNPNWKRSEVRDIVQETGIKIIPMEKKCKKAKWLSEEVVKIAVKRREAKSKGEKIFPFE